MDSKVDELKKRLDNLYKLQAKIMEDIHSELTGKEVDEILGFISNHPFNKSLGRTNTSNKINESPGIS